MHSIELTLGMYITDHRRTNPIDFGEYRMFSFFYRSTKITVYSYKLRPMESNSLKRSSIQTMRLIKFKFGIYIMGNTLHIVSILVSLGFNIFFFNGKKNFYALQPTESNYKYYS